MQLENYIHIESDAVPLDFCDEIVKEYDDDEYERCLLYTSPSPRDS